MAELGILIELPTGQQRMLSPLRDLILATARELPGVGTIDESLKWGEPSYTPLKKGIGSSVRLAVRKDGKVLVNFICHTGLVDRFREAYAGQMEFVGNRSIIIDPAAPIPLKELQHCIAMALTYFKNR